MKVFIMAQGHGSRWSDFTHLPLPCHYKQHIPIGEEVLIGRTLRQIKGYTITLVATIGFVSHLESESVALLTLPDPVGALLDGLFNICTYWENDDITILLGDVIYSNAMMDKILNPTTSPAVYGRTEYNKVTGKDAPELFALTFSKGHHHKILPSLRVDGGKLWGIQKSLELPVVEIDGDYTDDIDSPQEYYKFYNKLLEAAIEDDKSIVHK